MCMLDACRSLSSTITFFVLTLRSPVRNSLAQLVGTMAHHCDDLNEWPQLLGFLETYVKSEDVTERQVRQQKLLVNELAVLVSINF